MEEAGNAAGIALLCDEHGRVLEVLSDRGELLGQVRGGATLSSIVTDEHRQSARSFVDTAREQGSAFDWKMSLPAAHEAHFSAFLRDEHLYVVAGVPANQPCGYYDRLLEAHNQQINPQRSVMTESSMRDRTHRDREVEMLEDITRLNNELVSAQRELARKNAVLERLNEEKNNFLGMAAHDVRSPLSTVVMYSDLLIEQLVPDLTPDQVELLSEIRRAGELTADLVDDFLDVASIEAGKLRLRTQETDLAELMERTLRTRRALAHQKGIEVRAVHKDVLPPVMVDPGKIQQVLDNLISNATKFSPSGSVVKVQLRKQDHYAVFDIVDNGPGIPREEMDQLFQPFGRTSVQSTGGEESTGLGLLIVKRIVEGHGGRVSADSEPGAGTTFTVHLPLRRSAAESKEMEAVDEEEIRGRPALDILLVEDNEGHRAVARQLLERMGHRITTAADAAMALAELSRRSYDVVLMDVEMPGMSGLDAARKIRGGEAGERQPHIIAVTAKSRLVAKEESEAAGMNDFIEKPATYRKLESALAQVRLNQSSESPARN